MDQNLLDFYLSLFLDVGFRKENVYNLNLPGYRKIITAWDNAELSVMTYGTTRRKKNITDCTMIYYVQAYICLSNILLMKTHTIIICNLAFSFKKLLVFELW